MVYILWWFLGYFGMCVVDKCPVLCDGVLCYIVPQGAI